MNNKKSKKRESLVVLYLLFYDNFNSNFFFKLRIKPKIKKQLYTLM